MKRLCWALVAMACAPTLAPACDEAAIKLFVAEEYRQASKAFELAVERRPNDAECRLWLGRALGRRAERASGFSRLGAFSLARRVRENFAKAVELDPQHVVALESLFGYYSEAPRIIGGGLDKAEGLIDRIAALDPAAGMRARATLHAKRDYFDQAEAAHRKAIELDPDEIGHELSLASFLARRERFEESDKLFDRLLKENPDSPEVWFAFGKELARAGRRKAEARRLLERYLATPLYKPDAEPYSVVRDLLKDL